MPGASGAVDRDGVRLRPRKDDLQHWRETFAEKLVERGIAANATARRTRGIVLKAEKQAVVHINRDYEEGKRPQARTMRGQIADAEHEVATGEKRVNPAEQNIKPNRRETVRALGAIARALATGETEDKQLALKIVEFVRAMPMTATRHDALVRAIKARKEQVAQIQRSQGRDP